MEPIEVKARFSSQGQAIPFSFTWRNKQHFVSSVGRRWQDETGQHMLVLTTRGRTYELVYQPAQEKWYMARSFAGGLSPA